MPLVHQHQVVSLESVHGHGLLAHLLLEFGDLQNFHRLPGEESAPVFVEDFRVDTGLFELAQVLLGEPFVGREQNDPVEFPGAAVGLKETPVLENVRVHEQRLAAAGGHPEGDLVEWGQASASSINGSIRSASSSASSSAAIRAFKTARRALGSRK